MANKTWRCAICLVFLSLTLKELMTHINYAHSGANFFVACGVDNCPNSFQTYPSFYKHVKRRHSEFYENGQNSLRRQVVGLPLDGGFLGAQETSEMENENNEPTQPAGQTGIPRNPDSRMNLCIAQEQRQKSASYHVLQMKYRHHLTGEGITTLISGCRSIVDQSVEVIKKKIRHQMKYDGFDEAVFDSVAKVVDSASLEPIFTDVDNRYLQEKHMRDNYKRVNPKEIVLGSSIKQRRFGFKQRLSQVPDCFYYIPILDSLEQYFQNEKIFQMISSDQEKSCNDHMADICDGELLKRHPILSAKGSLRILLYYDDIEVCGPLGSKSRKLGCFYYLLANLPKRYRSKLCNIRLVAVALKSVLDKYGIDEILAPFVEDMKTLATGYSFNILGEPVVLKGGLYCILGDTPASHLAGGFKEGVGGAFRKCRMCYCTAENMQTIFSEDGFRKRTLADYISDCDDLENADTDYMRNYLSTLYGITRRSCLTEIPHFDICTCLPQDIMHVVMEGVAQYEIKETLLHYINEGVFSLQEFNYALEHFQYGYQDMKDRPSAITGNTLNSGDHKLKQNSAQTSLLIKIILFVLLTLGVDKNSPKYQFMVSFVEMSKLLLAPVFTLGSLNNLRKVIMNHLQMFKEVFPHCNIIPKHHYLVHFPTCMKYHGPANGYSCMRFEGKNKVPKTIAHKKNNFINVPLTVSVEISNIEAMDSFVASESMHPLFANDVIPGPSTQLLREKKDYFCDKMESFYGIFDRSRLVYGCGHITYLGTKYIAERAILAKGINDEGFLPEFGKLTNIYVLDMKEIYFELQMYDTMYYEETLQSYRVCEPELPEGRVLCKVDDLLDHHVYSIVLWENMMFVPSDFDFTEIVAHKLCQCGQ